MSGAVVTATLTRPRELAEELSSLKIPGVDRLMLPVFKKVIDELLKGGITAAERRA